MLQKLKEQLNRKKYNLIICAVLFALCIVQTMVMCRVRADELQTGRNLFILLHAAAWVLMAFFVMWGQLRSGYSRWRYIAGAVLMAAGVAGSIFLELTADYQLTASVGRGAVFSVIVAAVEVFRRWYRCWTDRDTTQSVFIRRRALITVVRPYGAVWDLIRLCLRME